MNDAPASSRPSRAWEAMLVLEAIAPLLIGIAAILLLILAFYGASSHYGD